MGDIVIHSGSGVAYVLKRIILARTGMDDCEHVRHDGYGCRLRAAQEPIPIFQTAEGFVEQADLRAFMTGISASLRLGADIIVNTDADNQYQAGDITKLIGPIVSGHADIVVGARPIADIEHFSAVKKSLQRLGSGAIKWLTGADVTDATSGFRAISRDAALRLNVFTPFTYTLETIIQGARSGMKIVSVPIGVGPPTRPSRLFRSLWQYLRRSLGHILWVYAPLRTYGALGLIPFALATIKGDYRPRLNQAGSSQLADPLFGHPAP